MEGEEVAMERELGLRKRFVRGRRCLGDRGLEGMTHTVTYPKFAFWNPLPADLPLFNSQD